MQSARSHAFLALTHMPGLVSVKPVYLLDRGLAAIAARSPFGTKVGIILPFLLMVMMTGRRVGAGGGALREAIGTGGVDHHCYFSHMAMLAFFGSFSTFLYLFFCTRSSFLLLAMITGASARSNRLFVLGFSFQDGG